LSSSPQDTRRFLPRPGRLARWTDGLVVLFTQDTRGSYSRAKRRRTDILSRVWWNVLRWLSSPPRTLGVPTTLGARRYPHGQSLSSPPRTLGFPYDRGYLLTPAGSDVVLSTQDTGVPTQGRRPGKRAEDPLSSPPRTLGVPSYGYAVYTTTRQPTSCPLHPGH